MRVLLVIPARGGSKAILRKNLAPVGGKPLIAYAIANALAAAAVDDVVVSTEDDEIASTASALGASVPFRRPSELATDAVSLIPVVAHAAEAMAKSGAPADLVASLQPTAPMLAPATIDHAVRLCLESGCDSVCTVRRVDHNHPYRIQSLAPGGRLVPLIPEGESFLQKQDLPPYFAISGGLYVRRARLLREWDGRTFCLGADRRAVVVGEDEALDIDTALDLAVFRAIVAEGGHMGNADPARKAMA